MYFESFLVGTCLAGGLVVDYPNSTKAKKFFLVLMTGGSQPLPQV
jgi:hypothetical protein